ncbi:DNA adenine methylase [Parabacteroides provencensis]|uniref:DNA adenine methylase n=1 Tax=Parabacteroides provencensis TaxID=1944636 RepID=UPI000C14A2FB|nr:DNA adenine methylase [Parabacteroides provencensis]
MVKSLLKTPISYYGGKLPLLKHILPLIPKHTLFTEAFCGGCAVFFAKEPVECEVINDMNRELINFYRIAQTRYPELKAQLDGTLHSRDSHAHARHINAYPEFFTEIERAWSVWVCSKMGFASMLDGTFGYDRSGTTALKLFNAKDSFTEMLCNRLKKVTIENGDGIRVITRYDCETAFHFVDPPYVGSDCGHYAGSFNEENFSELLETLAQIKGKFMLTMFPHDKIREFANHHKWKIHKIERTISASKTSRRRQEEWITCNYELK